MNKFSVFVGGYYSVNFQNARCNNKDNFADMFVVGVVVNQSID
jgi:hypothetical protein